jgi:hypothetical protein
MALGVDTASSLGSINWTAFKNWCGVYPVYAGRYFGSGYGWTPGEFVAANKATSGVLNKIIPIQASRAGNQQATGATGYNYGVSDAVATCQSIKTAIGSGELALPSSGSVYVYLNVEQGTVLSTDYWAAWSSNVFNFFINGSAPFWPCVYTWYGPESNGKYSPSAYVQNALNSGYSVYPDHESLCYGLWSNEPEPSRYYNFPSVDPDWSVFSPCYQATPGAIKPVPLLLYQFAEQSNNPSFAGGQNLDLDSDNSSITGAQNYMLLISA